MKPREFHLNPKKSLFGFHVAQKFNGLESHWIRVREVVPIDKIKNPSCDATCPNYAHPIDWDKVWGHIASLPTPLKEQISYQVQKQLAGDTGQKHLLKSDKE